MSFCLPPLYGKQPPNYSTPHHKPPCRYTLPLQTDRVPLPGARCRLVFFSLSTMTFVTLPHYDTTSSSKFASGGYPPSVLDLSFDNNVILEFWSPLLTTPYRSTSTNVFSIRYFQPPPSLPAVPSIYLLLYSGHPSPPFSNLNHVSFSQTKANQRLGRPSFVPPFLGATITASARVFSLNPVTHLSGLSEERNPGASF